MQCEESLNLISARIDRELSGDDLRLYELVWKRTVASQMADAVGQRVQVRVTGVTEVDGRTEVELVDLLLRSYQAALKAIKVFEAEVVP